MKFVHPCSHVGCLVVVLCGLLAMSAGVPAEDVLTFKIRKYSWSRRSYCLHIYGFTPFGVQGYALQGASFVDTFRHWLFVGRLIGQR